MINNDRVVSVTKVDLLSLYALIIKQTETDLVKVTAQTVEGDYSITAAATALIADQPIKSCDFTADVSTATLYFVADYAFEGFKVAGADVEVEADIAADAVTLYKAELSGGAVTVTEVGF